MLMIKSSHDVSRCVCVYIYMLPILFPNVIKYFIAAAITSGVVNQWLLVVDARIILK